MATKLDLLLDFENGQGIAGGASQYTDYGVDFDTNFTSVQTTVNQMIDEINAARLPASQLPTDLLLRRDLSTEGRFTQQTAAVTRSGDTVTVASGLIYAAGLRILVVGATFDLTALINGTYFINTDVNGLLSLSSTASDAAFDIVTIVWDGSLVDGDVTDNLYFGGRTLVNTDSGFMQEVHIPPEESANSLPAANLYPARVNPTLRYVGSDGTLGSAGFSPAGMDEFIWISALGLGAITVVGATLGNVGQQLLFEQARVTAIATADTIATGAGSAILFDAPVANASNQRSWRREPQSYSGQPFIGAAANTTLTVPGNAELAGTYMCTFTATFPTTGGTYRWGSLRATNATLTAICETRVAASATGDTIISGAGMIDLAQNDTIQLFIEHDTGVDQDVTARVSLMLIGGPV